MAASAACRPTPRPPRLARPENLSLAGQPDSSCHFALGHETVLAEPSRLSHHPRIFRRQIRSAHLSCSFLNCRSNTPWTARPLFRMSAVEDQWLGQQMDSAGQHDCQPQIGVLEPCPKSSSQPDVCSKLERRTTARLVRNTATRNSAAKVVSGSL